MANALTAIRLALVLPMAVALARPELLARRPALGGRRTSVVRLDPLDDMAMASLVDGLVAGLPSVPVLHGPNESAAPSELRVAPGQTASVRLTLRGVPHTPVTVRWQVAAPKGLTVSPSAGNRPSSGRSSTRSRRER